jgi:hypothetical protein
MIKMKSGGGVFGEVQKVGWSMMMGRSDEADEGITRVDKKGSWRMIENAVSRAGGRMLQKETEQWNGVSLII